MVIRLNILMKKQTKEKKNYCCQTQAIIKIIILKHKSYFHFFAFTVSHKYLTSGIRSQKSPPAVSNLPNLYKL